MDLGLSSFGTGWFSSRASTSSSVVSRVLLNLRTRSTAGAVTFCTHRFCSLTFVLNGFGGFIFLGGRYFLGIQSMPPPVSPT